MKEFVAQLKCCYVAGPTHSIPHFIKCFNLNSLAAISKPTQLDKFYLIKRKIKENKRMA